MFAKSVSGEVEEREPRGVSVAPIGVGDACLFRNIFAGIVAESAYAEADVGESCVVQEVVAESVGFAHRVILIASLDVASDAIATTAGLAQGRRLGKDDALIACMSK